MHYKVTLLLSSFVLPAVTGSLLLLITDTSADAAVNLTLNILLSRHAIAPTINFEDSNWIWTGEQAIGEFSLMNEDPYSIVVNGAKIGSGSGSNSSAVYIAGLNSGATNVFAITVNSTGGDSSFIATILIDYTDGMMETFITDSTWKTLQAVPLVSEATPWDIPPLPPALNMMGVSWIQTNETDGSGVDPIGHRPFRKTVALLYGKAAVCGKVVITADDAYTMYINGDNISSSDIGWRYMQAYSVSMLNETVDLVVIAIDSNNIEPSFVGLITGVLLAYNDGMSETLYMDDSWKTLTEPTPDGFEVIGLDDSTWINATEFIHSDVETVVVPLA
ncbi:uncharacterized protein EV420DRAFT_1673214 [Desarmillaria tabescens]|uniref:Uncharacterized protein n=1 Tax=Armillaria tabescens TaxID=1929756 RepID=A0AA39KHH6_ARMTA|nr:uncharacterized protein EV420DRAFT_1673214 [Desarmillaria tabescens]KAK0460155.1 hypothetical protein EV420DRAFT_1673214 [Desarmillaria tabescens]